MFIGNLCNLDKLYNHYEMEQKKLCIHPVSSFLALYYLSVWGKEPQALFLKL